MHAERKASSEMNVARRKLKRLVINRWIQNFAISRSGRPGDFPNADDWSMVQIVTHSSHSA
jgi:hypothetical protein